MPRNTKGASKKGRSAAQKKKRAAPGKLTAVPAGFRTVTPYLNVNGGFEALEFYKKAFGAKELTRQTTPDGKVVHARIKIGDSIVMLSDQFGPSTAASAGVAPPESMGPGIALHIYSKDVNKLWQQATEAGARIVMEIDDQYWGERYGQVVDPFGHRWSMSMRVKMSKEEKERKEKEAMAMFAKAQHPEQQPAGTA